MKNKHSIFRWLLAAVLPALFLTACSKDNDVADYPGTPDSGGDIRFEIGFAPQGGGTMNAQTDSSDVPLTRVTTDAAFKSTWEAGDEIGVFAVPAGTSLAASDNYIHNAKLTYSSANGGTWTPAEPLYWPTNAYSKSLDFYAYYPYTASATDPTNIAFKVQADQSGTTDGKSNYSLSDLLTAKTAGVSKGTDGKVSLTFSHALAMVQVAIPGGKGWGGSERLTVTLRGMKPGATLNLGDIGTDAPGIGISVPTTGNDATAITMYRMAAPTAGNYIYRALVPAQTVAQGQSLFFFDNDGRQLFTDGVLSSPLDMTAGRAEKFERTLPIVETGTKIPAGKFKMGSSDGSNSASGALATDVNTDPEDPDADSSERPQHWVEITKDFYMSKYEVTNSQYAAFLNAAGVGVGSDGKEGKGDVTYSKDGNDPVTERQIFIYRDAFGVTHDGTNWIAQSGYEDHPVLYVTWYGAKAFADYYGYSLPTEAQWEYACRAGTTTIFSYGNAANEDYMWYSDNDDSPSGPKKVGIKLSNLWGLHDMHGNVLEWCLDQWNGNENYPSAATKDAAKQDPLVTSGDYRVVRGGFWDDYARRCRSAYRNYYRPSAAGRDTGFRVVVFP
ncbi:SUMF1/EgtB/PvdO family nonheme iron enzyme [Bacteroides hominis]|uniref:SUMF1/EgtB/PvdO family nonheme iron enzyme n=1 Tax=Bacteroides hominis TaxID=2763023 RepID=UPI00164B164D|nr:SUMF1/EgtB/PvdO family nonheme iron enzyme [Bacteroides hominis (ex Liu et al. 2022)]MBC5614550.1 SUMF1/EgtB/PvdO family nonheme iron enzyme [Bacteroides hominis (ex Liu et al. 2022)]